MSRTASTSGQARKRALQAGVVAFGQFTSRSRVPPALLLAGGQRCGTTSMYRALAQHPAVFKPVLHKGVHYFDMHYSMGMSWYLGHFASRRALDRAEQRLGVRPITFESSPYYLSHPLAPQRIAHDLPGVRLLVLLRDPVERAYSAHSHETARGFESVSFEEALELEQERLRGEQERIVREPTYVSPSHQHHAYVSRGRYIEHLETLESAVGRDRIHVLDSHDFFSAPEESFRGVTDFLGLPSRGGIQFDRHNARSRAPMAESVRHRLVEHFVPYDERLTSWLGRTPSWRR